ncbi:MAG: hypothetical protein AAGF24_09075 [Cyanobacteria bacterium P01_H01_bin.121]
MSYLWTLPITYAQSWWSLVRTQHPEMIEARHYSFFANISYWSFMGEDAFCD